MKKIILTTILSLMSMFFFTGCLSYNVNFEPKYVEHESIKYISNKEENLEVNIVSDETNIKIMKKPTTKFEGQGIRLDIENSFIEKTLEDNLKQYFKNVKIIKEEKNEMNGLIIKVKLINFEWAPLIGFVKGGQASKFIIEIKVYKENKEILNKVYKEYYEKENILLGTFLSNSELVNYLKSKDLFEMYNTKFIPDLAKALKENQ